MGIEWGLDIGRRRDGENAIASVSDISEAEARRSFDLVMEMLFVD